MIAFPSRFTLDDSPCMLLLISDILLLGLGCQRASLTVRYSTLIFYAAQPPPKKPACRRFELKSVGAKQILSSRKNSFLLCLVRIARRPHRLNTWRAETSPFVLLFLF